VALDQHGCMYQPHVLGVMAGQKIDIKNSDTTNHNIHPLPQTNQEWNESQPPGSDVKVQSFPRQEVMIPVKCNIHPWMRSYIGVVSHPFFAVTGDDGTFTIKGLPPGTYTIETWHEKYGTQDQQITVGPKESKTVDFSFKG
jgi:plastocyanin